MTTEEMLAGCLTWIRQTYQKRNRDPQARADCKKWIREYRRIIAFFEGL